VQGAVDAGTAQDSAGAKAPAPAAAPETTAAGSAEASAGSANGSVRNGGAVPPITAVPTDRRQVIRTADLAVRLSVPPARSGPGTGEDAASIAKANADARRDAAGKASSGVRVIATSSGGYVESADGSGWTMTITMRVPVERYEAVINKILALGVLTGRTESSQDVTADVVDMNSRVTTMTASVARIRTLLSKATRIGDVIAIESELAVREADLESLEQQQASLGGQVALSTVSVSLTAVTDDPATRTADTTENGFVAGLASGWNALLDFLRWIGTAVGAVLPFLPLVAVAGLVGWWLVRRRPRGRGSPAPPG